MGVAIIRMGHLICKFSVTDGEVAELLFNFLDSQGTRQCLISVIEVATRWVG